MGSALGAVCSSQSQSQSAAQQPSHAPSQSVDYGVYATPQTPLPRVPFSTPLTPPDSSKSRSIGLDNLLDGSGSANKLAALAAPIDLSQLSSALESPLAQKGAAPGNDVLDGLDASAYMRAF